MRSKKYKIILLYLIHAAINKADGEKLTVTFPEGEGPLAGITHISFKGKQDLLTIYWREISPFCGIIDKRLSAQRYMKGYLGELNQKDSSHNYAHLGFNREKEITALHIHYRFSKIEGRTGQRLIEEYKKAFDILSQMNNKYICNNKIPGKGKATSTLDNAWMDSSIKAQKNMPYKIMLELIILIVPALFLLANSLNSAEREYVSSPQQ